MKNIPTVTRWLLIVNVICYVVQLFFKSRGIDLSDVLGLHFMLASDFSVVQLFSYMFLHGSRTHLFFNMFSLWMFGGIIENTLGQKRFLIYYMVCGVGAGLCQELWQTAQYFIEELGSYEYDNTGVALILMDDYLNQWTTIGASGACYGVLLAFGMLYPNEWIMLLIPPIPMMAKYFVAGYAPIELFSAYASNDNIAHFAHLGGMLFGWGLLVWWRRKSHNRTTVGGWERWDTPQRDEPLFARVRYWFTHLFDKKTATAGNARHTATRESDYEENMRRKAEEDRMDEILDKVRRSGYDSLTPEEKRELFRISRK